MENIEKYSAIHQRVQAKLDRRRSIYPSLVVNAEAGKGSLESYKQVLAREMGWQNYNAHSDTITDSEVVKLIKARNKAQKENIPFNVSETVKTTLKKFENDRVQVWKDRKAWKRCERETKKLEQWSDLVKQKAWADRVFDEVITRAQEKGSADSLTRDLVKFIEEQRQEVLKQQEPLVILASTKRGWRRAVVYGTIAAAVSIALFIGVSAFIPKVTASEAIAYQSSNSSTVSVSVAEVSSVVNSPVPEIKEEDEVKKIKPSTAPQSASRSITAPFRVNAPQSRVVLVLPNYKTKPVVVTPRQEPSIVVVQRTRQSVTVPERVAVASPNTVSNSPIRIRRDLLSLDLQNSYTEQAIAQKCADVMPRIQRYFPRQAWEAALMVALAESSCNPGATNRNSDGSIDRGYFQINNVHRDSIRGNLYDPEYNVRFAAKLYLQEGFNPWMVCRGYGNGLTNRVNCRN